MICGEKVNLRPLEGTDLAQLVAWRNDPETFRGFFATFPLSLSAQNAWFEDLVKREDKKLFIIENKQRTAVGTVGFDQINWKNQRAEFGNMLVAKEHRGQGYAYDATKVALRFGFDQMNLNRIYLEVYAWNQSAVRLYQKCGFQVEGVLRQASYAEGKFHDVVLMSVVREEWRERFNESPPPREQGGEK